MVAHMLFHLQLLGLKKKERTSKEESLAKDRREVLLTRGDGGRGSHEGYLTKRQAERYYDQ